MVNKKYPVYFSDTEIGHPDFGYILRKSDEDPDDEDIRLQRYLSRQGITARVVNGHIWILEAS